MLHSFWNGTRLDQTPNINIYMDFELMICTIKKYSIVNIFLKQQLLDDPAIISAIDEETEFNALVICMRQNLTYWIC